MRESRRFHADRLDARDLLVEPLDAGGGRPGNAELMPPGWVSIAGSYVVPSRCSGGVRQAVGGATMSIVSPVGSPGAIR